jgi:hypothetical protein
MTRREPPPERCGRRGHKAMKHRRSGDRGGRNEQQHEVDGDNASEKSGHRQRQGQMLKIAAARNPADEARRFQLFQELRDASACQSDADDRRAARREK